MSETKGHFRGPVLGFISAETPDDLTVLNIDQCLAAFVHWSAAQLHAEAPQLQDTTVFLEGHAHGLIQTLAAGALYRCYADEFAAQLVKSHPLSSGVFLFIGSPSFLHECAVKMMDRLAPPQDKEFDDVRPKFSAEVEELARRVGRLLPGEVCRFGFLYFDGQRFAQAHMMPMIMQYLHHDQRLGGVEAAFETFPPVHALSPTWPKTA